MWLWWPLQDCHLGICSLINVMFRITSYTIIEHAFLLICHCSCHDCEHLFHNLSIDHRRGQRPRLNHFENGPWGMFTYGFDTANLPQKKIFTAFDYSNWKSVCKALGPSIPVKVWFLIVHNSKWAWQPWIGGYAYYQAPPMWNSWIRQWLWRSYNTSCTSSHFARSRPLNGYIR